MTNSNATETPLTETPPLETIAAQLGLTDDDLVKVISRAGSRALALQRLRQRVTSREKSHQRAQERRRAEARATDARDRHTKVRADERSTTTQTRKDNPLAKRLGDVLNELELASTAPGAGEVVGARSPADSKAPPRQALPPVGWRIEAVRFQIERLEHELDAIHGREPATELTGAQKDVVIIMRYPGVHSGDVAEAAPELGSRRTIERVRARYKLKPTTGLPYDDDAPTPTNEHDDPDHLPKAAAALGIELDTPTTEPTEDDPIGMGLTPNETATPPTPKDNPAKRKDTGA